MQKSNIPHFGLYGESSWINDPEFFHIEDIESRSGDLGWKINPHRHAQLFQILILKSGEVKISARRATTQATRCMGDYCSRWRRTWFSFCTRYQWTSHQYRREPLLEDAYKEKAAKFIQPLLSQACYIDFNGHRNMFSELWPLIQQLESESSFIREGRALMSEYLIKSYFAAAPSPTR